MIRIERLWKDYGDDRVLENVNAEVRAGEFVTIVGASGCGKTTFLKLLLGSERPTRGGVWLDGRKLREEPDAERGIVFQRYSVFPHLTVLDNVVIALELGARTFGARLIGRLFGASRRAAKAEALALLESVGLADASRRYPGELSGGMQQRLAIAQALAGKPRILLLDEPFGALDPGIRADMQDLTLALWAEHGLTVFMITHDIAEAFRLGTRLWVFDKVRADPHQPNRYGACITYDLPVRSAGADARQRVAETLNGLPDPRSP